MLMKLTLFKHLGQNKIAPAACQNPCQKMVLSCFQKWFLWKSLSNAAHFSKDFLFQLQFSNKNHFLEKCLTAFTH